MLNGLEQFLGPPGLEKVVINLAAVDGLDGFFELGKAGHKQADGLWMVTAPPLQQLHARHAGHFLVTEDQVDVGPGELTLGGIGGISSQHVEVSAEQGSQGGEDVGFVIHNQKRALLLAHLEASWTE